MWDTVKVAEVYWKMLLNFSSVTTEAAGHDATVMTENLIYRKIHRCSIPHWVAANVALIKAESYVLFTCIYSEKKIISISHIFVINTPFVPSHQTA